MTSTSAVLLAAVLGALLGAVLVLVVALRARAAATRDAWEALAAALGLTWTAKDDTVLADIPGRDTLFEQRDPSVTNVLRGDRGEHQILVFDYSHRFGPDQRARRTHGIAWVRLAGGRFPRVVFARRPEGEWATRSTDQVLAASLLTPGVLAALSSLPAATGLTLYGDRVQLHRDGSFFDTAELASTLDAAVKVATALPRR